ncbi:hypothetical protein [Amycolatopsis sp. NPDC058986]|uniref:hypothetical protein n=1 Tax=unclassified Amycolatopsis TaxID=2618356 RepID=UPI003671E937
MEKRRSETVLGEQGSREGGADQPGPSPSGKTGPDEKRDESVRVCGYRRCGAALPQVSGRGNRPRFCQDGKTWGSRGLNCRDAEAALVDADSLREADTELDDTAVAALAGEIDRVLDPARGLVEVLATIRQQLDATVAAALAERDSAHEEADEHRRQRGLAEADATLARQQAEKDRARAAEAEREQAKAVKERDDQRAARKAAAQEQQRTSGQLAAVRDELVRANQRAEAAAALAGDRATALASATAELAASQSALVDERARSQAAAARAEVAELQAASARDRIDALHEQLSAATAAHETALASARADADRLRTEFDERVTTIRAEHDRSVRTMHDTTLALGAELRTLTERNTAAERDLGRLLDVLAARPDDEALPDGVRKLLAEHVR